MIFKHGCHDFSVLLFFMQKNFFFFLFKKDCVGGNGLMRFKERSFVMIVIVKEKEF